MKSAPNATLTEFILCDAIGGAVCKPRIKTQYWSDTQSTWANFEDVESRSISLSIENNRYQAYSFLPPVKTINLTLNNFGQVYSTGSGNPKASILKKNLLVRAYTGYQLTAGQTLVKNDDYISNNGFYKTIKSGASIIPSSINITETYSTLADLGTSLYGDATYGTGTYEYFGYYHKTFVTDREQQPLAINLNTSSNKFSLKYRLDTDAWTAYQPLSTGSNSIPLTAGANYRNVETIIRFEADTYSTASVISNFNLSYDQESLYFLRGTFVIDEPRYSDKVQVTGRDYLRKALETEINLPSYTSATKGTKIVSDVLDRCNIPYDTATWDSVATTTSVSGTLAESLVGVSGWQALDFAMDLINAGNDDIIFRFTDEGKAEIKKIPTDIEADWTTHYKYNIESISKNFDSDSQLQRITALNKDIIVESETLLKTITGTLGTAGNITATYSDALYVRYTDVNNKIVREVSRENDSITFYATTGNYDINVYGCEPKNAITDEVWAELGNSDNMKSNDGSTYKKINPLFKQTVADAYCAYMIAKNANPKYTIELTQTPNPLVELGRDKWLVFDRYTYTDSLYIPVEINETWANPALKETVKLRDSGDVLGLFQWDRNGIIAGLNDLKYDIGLVWDMDLGVNAVSDTASYPVTERF